MSYILDALKKSEKERQKRNVPDLLTVQEPVLNEKRKRKLWPYILITVLILNMGFLGYLLGPEKSKKTKSDGAIVQQNELNPMESQKTEVPVTVPSAQELNQPKQTIKEKETKIAVVSVQQKKLLQGTAGQDQKVQEKAIDQTVKPAIKKPANETQSVHAKTRPEEPRVSAAASVPDEQKPVITDVSSAPDKIYNLGELPSSIKQNLPAVNVSIFMYSEDPASRMVRINGQTYREGQKISEDLILERITPNGIILNYKNYRFQAGQQHP